MYIQTIIVLNEWAHIRNNFNNPKKYPIDIQTTPPLIVFSETIISRWNG